jgi:hypothetical protein
LCGYWGGKVAGKRLKDRDKKTTFSKKDREEILSLYSKI